MLAHILDKVGIFSTGDNDASTVEILVSKISFF